MVEDLTEKLAFIKMLEKEGFKDRDDFRRNKKQLGINRETLIKCMREFLKKYGAITFRELCKWMGDEYCMKLGDRYRRYVKQNPENIRKYKVGIIDAKEAIREHYQDKKLSVRFSIRNINTLNIIYLEDYPESLEKHIIERTVEAEKCVIYKVEI